MEGASSNENLKNLDVGTVSDDGLRIMARELEKNVSLQWLTFTENPDKTWTKGAKRAFADAIRDYTKIETITMNTCEHEGEDDPHAEFKEEILYYT